MKIRVVFIMLMVIMFFNAKSQVTTLAGDYKIINIGDNTYGDYTRSLVLLHEVYNGTLIDHNYAIGTITAMRGTSGSYNRLNVVNVTTSSAYNGISGTITSNDDNSAWALKTCIYNGKKYLAVDIPYADAHHSWGYYFSGWTISTGESMKCVSYEVSGVPVNTTLISNIQDFSSNMVETHNVAGLNITGNVGIGTTSPQRKLDLSNSGQLTFGDDVVTDSNNGIYWNSGSNYAIYRTPGLWSGDGYQQLRIQFDTGIQLGAGLGNNAGFGKSYVEIVNGKGLMVSSGNVGIGTTSPAVKLDVVGGVVNVTNPNPTYTLIDNSNSNYSWAVQNTAGAYRFYDITANAERMRISSNGNVGIGTTSLSSKLDVNGSINIVSSGNLTWGGVYGAGVPTIAANSIAGLVFYPGGSTSGESLRINPSGNVGIGTTDPKGYKLAVAGDAIAESMTVDLQANWPDFVFKKDYSLTPLAEVKAYIDKNQHLPGVPTSDEVSKKGINLGETNALLMKKVEELTLYLIEKDKQDKEKDVRLVSQQQQIDELKQQITGIIATQQQKNTKAQ